VRTKYALLLLAGVLIAVSILFAVIINKTHDTQLDLIEINDVVKTLSTDWDDIAAGQMLAYPTNGLDFVVFDTEGTALLATREGLVTDLTSATRERYIMVDVISGDHVVGKVAFFNDIQASLDKQREQLMGAAVILVALLAILCAVYTFYLHRKIIMPFGKIQDFATRIAAGNLETPLEMDRGHLFGAFTESFDIMREELHRARENERSANQSKKELVASLSHDIKTPVATIQAVAETMEAQTLLEGTAQLTEADQKTAERLQIISAKARQIDSLVTNMFHATLEELQELKVAPIEIASTDIAQLIHNADHEERARPFTLPECIVLADSLRLSQVFDNIVGNSYKYAGTPLEITSAFEEDRLMIALKDQGPGIPEKDLSLITTKYYRGENAEGKSGYGLGLYISKYLMNQMQGDLFCENHADGFSVTLVLQLA